ncbi:MAG TPA: serine/threonine-protein kinase [Planctomycetaceae bacterium]|nr:serine/threonine-protein kinase [Planctomycetaceae bacterium]
MPLALPAPVISRTEPSPAPPRSHEFELLELAGRGSFADVWKVRDRKTGRLYALKQLRKDRQDHPAARRLLENEFEVGRKASSEHVVKVCEACVDAPLPYVALEWLSGRTLESRLAGQSRASCREALWIARQCAQGMHALLVSGYVHGDIKPSNIFLCDDGVVKLIDLGFARPDRRSNTELADASSRNLMGTPEYLAPEALLPGNLGGTTRDVYSLGVTLFRLLTGSLPFQSESVTDVLKQHQQSLPPRLRALAPDVPREVADFVSRLLSKQPLRRGGGLSWLVGELIGLELLVLAD